MPTTITFHGQNATFEHPRELRHWGYPKPPLQPIASWAVSLAAFEVHCNADQFKLALEWLAAEYVYATTADVPAGKLAALKLWIQNNMRAIPTYLHGPAGDWRTDGVAMERSGFD